ncbi:hypothetical protein BH683_004455 [Williamsia sp. 1138]|uniref:hypothetical protein n=1 Tax=Williamsia sp. 1138 TaxID=1903117 RepID=UPI000A10DC5C|nr:hypothetical protein [Williamsia sp. 1138]OZG30396.1 hypothetical protein BH683_004455 [Williamsia sp. 1138]
MPNQPLIRRGVVALAIAASAAVMSPALAVADPVPLADLTLTAPTSVPADKALSAAIAQLQKTRVDPEALAAAKAILGVGSQLPTTMPVKSEVAAPTATPAASPTDVLTLLAEANSALRQMGIQSFINPSVAFNCTEPTPDNPFGLLPAVGGAVPGPFFLPGLKLPAAIDANLVKDGETLFGFVPSGITKDGAASGMQVAWFNVNTLQGGFAEMAPVGTTLVDIWMKKVPDNPFKGQIKAALTTFANRLSVPGSRLAPVKSGNGTVLSAVFGTVENGNRSCFFLPMIGITQA